MAVVTTRGIMGQRNKADTYTAYNGGKNMKFRNLAWGAFIFAGMTKNDYMSPYQELIADTEFLGKLQTEPSLSEFQRLRDFLTRYGVPWAPTNLANQYVSIWPRLKPYICRLASEAIESSALDQEDIANAIKAAYGYLQWPNVWGGDTVASKVLHFFNVRLFVMWDSDIQTAYGKPIGAEGYLGFLKDMQNHAKEAIADFQWPSLSDTVTQYLSQQLGYGGVRPLTKFIDDYNWVTITKGWSTAPPDWLTKLYSNK